MEWHAECMQKKYAFDKDRGAREGEEEIIGTCPGRREVFVLYSYPSATTISGTFITITIRRRIGVVVT